MRAGEAGLAEAVRMCLMSEACEDSNGDRANVVDGLYAIAEGLEAVARSIVRLGNNDAATSMGGLEALGMCIKEGFEHLAGTLAEAYERGEEDG